MITVTCRKSPEKGMFNVLLSNGWNKDITYENFGKVFLFYARDLNYVFIPNDYTKFLADQDKNLDFDTYSRLLAYQDLKSISFDESKKELF